MSLQKCENFLRLVCSLDFPGGSDGKKSTCDAGDLGSVPGLGRSPWRRARQPTLAFLPGESPWTEDLGGIQSTGSQRVTAEQISTSYMWLRHRDPFVTLEGVE